MFAILLRFVGVYPGYPEHTDEAGYSSAVTMILKGNLDPGRYDYPAGLPLLHTFLFKFLFIPIYWLKFFIQNLGAIIDGYIKFPLDPNEYKRISDQYIFGPREVNVMYWGRFVTAFFGVMVVLATYKLAKKVFNKEVGLISSFLVAVNFRQVLNSHIGLPDIYNSFFLITTSYFLYQLIENPKKIYYLLSGLFNGLYFSIKFQTFGFATILVAHILSSWKKSENFITNLKLITLSPNLYLSFAASFFVMVILNPYLFLKFEVFKSVQTYQLAKYGLGTDSLNIFPLSYLYHIGIGQWISLLVVIGIVLSSLKYFKKSLVLFLVAFQFMLTFVYLSRGGFYTRNFVTITPLLLVFAGVAIDQSARALAKTKLIYVLLVLSTTLIVSLPNIKNSLVINVEYSKPWNKKIIADWVSKNIPANSMVSAHPDTPLPVEGVKRSIFEPDDAFSIDEFSEQKSEFAISNSSWSTNSFYWWMNGSISDFRNLWSKPVSVMEYSYPAIALRELGQFNVYNISNPWQAPDTDFLVAKIPVFKVNSRILKTVYNFDKSEQGWKKAGLFWSTNDNLDLKDAALHVRQDSAPIASIRWESEPIDVANWKGCQIDYKIKSITDKPVFFETKKIRTGYVFLNFYKNKSDAEKSENRLAVRLGARNDKWSIWTEKTLVGSLPEGSNFMTIGFYNYSPAVSEVFLDDVYVYDADVNVNYNGFKIEPVKVDENNIFLNSHGNL